MAEKLSATQIEAMLKPMIDFAPAIIRAAEIVAEAKAAEGRSADSLKIIAGLNDQLAKLHESIAGFERRRDVARNEFNSAREETDAFKKTLEDERKQARAEHLRVLAEFAKDQAAAEEELRKLQGAVSVQKAELDAVTKAFEDFKKAHKL